MKNRSHELCAALGLAGLVFAACLPSFELDGNATVNGSGGRAGEGGSIPDAGAGEQGEGGASAGAGGVPSGSAGEAGSENAGAGNEGSVSWSRSVGGPTIFDKVKGLAADSEGNVFVAGEVASATVSFGCESHTIDAGRDAFLVKYSASGECRWSKMFGAPASAADSPVFASGVAVDANGDVLMVGFFDAGVELEPGSPLVGASDFYVAKFSGVDGALIWSRHYGTNAVEWGNGIALDGEGGIFVVGHYLGATTIGGFSLPAFGDNDMLVAKISDGDVTNGGTVIWARGFGAPAVSDVMYDVAVDESGDVIAAGALTGPATFDEVSVPNAGGNDVLVARLDSSDGAVVWAKSFGSSYRDRALAVAQRASKIFVAGSFTGSVNFGQKLLSSDSATEDALLLEIDSTNGEVLAADRWGGPAVDVAYAVAAADDGRVALGGSFGLTATGFATTLTAAGALDAFVVEQSQARELDRAWGFGESANEEVWNLAFDGTRALLVAGVFESGLDLGSPPLQSNGGNDVFVVRTPR